MKSCFGFIFGRKFTFYTMKIVKLYVCNKFSYLHFYFDRKSTYSYRHKRVTHIVFILFHYELELDFPCSSKVYGLKTCKRDPNHDFLTLTLKNKPTDQWPNIHTYISRTLIKIWYNFYVHGFLVKNQNLWKLSSRKRAVSEKWWVNNRLVYSPMSKPHVCNKNCWP